jgi:TonB-linked SusC/RagA family outer membrane protein
MGLFTVMPGRRLRLGLWIFSACLFPALLSAQEKITVSGAVYSESGEPLGGVSVVAKNTAGGASSSVLSNQKGQFKFDGLSSGAKYNFTLSSVGYEEKTLPAVVLGQGSTDLSAVKLRISTSSLDQVVVVGYGTQLRKEITGAVSSVGANEIKDQPVYSFEQAIAGKLPGVQVIQNTGAPGGSISIRIRGLNSISAGTDPLYVVDGFPISNDLKNLQGSTDVINIAGQASFQKAPDPMSTINPDDIESVEVLKDASAAAIYGSRGSNGVVIITTKRGKKNSPATFGYTGYYGFQSPSKTIDMMNAYQWSQLAFDGKNNSYLDANPNASITDNNTVRASPNYQIPPDILPYLAGQPGLVNTNWQNAVLRTAPIQDHTVYASGGSDKIQYYVSGNYFDQEGIVINSGYNRYGLRTNITANLTDKLKFGFSLNTTFDQYDLVNSEGPWTFDGILSNALKAAPIFPVYNPDGSYAINRQNTYAYSLSGGENPVALANEIKDNLNHVRNLGSVYGEYEIIPGLSFKTYFGADINYYDREYFRPSTLGTYKPVQQGTPTIPKGSSQTAIATNWVWENTLNYAFKVKENNHFSVLAGYTSQKNTTKATEVDGTGFPNNAVTTLNAATVTSGTSTESQWSLISFLGRVNYNFSEKYFLTASIRADGSSRFGANDKWGYFPSASVGWLASNEDFFKVESISLLKFRASYGLTGNFQIPNYASYDLMSSNNYILGNTNGNLVSGVGISQPANPDLTWEKTAQFNAGFDLGLFKDRIYLLADYYHATTSNLLLNVPVPLSSGFATALQNIGKVENYGVEFGLTTHNLVGAFTWNTNFNIASNKNNVEQLGPNGAPIISDGGNGTISQMYITKVGSPIGSYFGYVNGGVFKDQKDLDNSPHYPTAKPGDRKFLDVSGPAGKPDGVIDANDRTTIGSYFPKYIWGFINDFTYKHFDLSVALQAVEGDQIMNLQRRYLYNSEGNANQMTGDLGYWKSPTNPGNGQAMRANRVANANSEQISSFHVEDGSFVRLRNITLGYTFNQAVFSHVFKTFHIYVSGQNIYTWTKYTGYNPEVNARPDSPLSQGEDYGTYPLAKTFIAGVNLTF